MAAPRTGEVATCSSRQRTDYATSKRETPRRDPGGKSGWWTLVIHCSASSACVRSPDFHDVLYQNLKAEPAGP